MIPTYLIATCGRKPYLEWALRSLEAQTAPWRVMGFDNGSSDGSGQLLREFCEAHGGWFGSCLSFVDDGGWQSGIALLDAWDGHGIAALLHDDDMCHPSRTARIVECFESGAAPDLVMSSMWSFTTGQEPTALAGEPTTDSMWRCDPSRWGEGIGSVVGNTTTPTAAFDGRYLEIDQPKGYRSGAQDTLAWYKATRLGLRIDYIDEALYYYRLHPLQSSATFRARVPEFDEEIARIHQEAEGIE